MYQGGNSQDLQSYLGLESDEILYLGDHIYGDILALKNNAAGEQHLSSRKLTGRSLISKKEKVMGPAHATNRGKGAERKRN